MDAELLKSKLQESLSQPLALDVFDSLDSTNLEALRRIKSGDFKTTAIVARTQTAGRGRRGKNWVSHADTGIYFSLMRNIAVSLTDLDGLSLVAALAVHQGLTDLGASNLKLKWPNDILYRKRKLAGILLELQAPSSAEKQECMVIFGIGINVQLDDASRSEINQAVTDLAETDIGEVTNESVIVAVLQKLEEYVGKFERDGFRPYQAHWNELDHYLNQDIVIDNAGKRQIGKAAGVNDAGHLVLRTLKGEETISGGEIFPSLRPAPQSEDQS